MKNLRIARLFGALSCGILTPFALEPQLNPYWMTGLLLVCSNVFMTFAWYAHLKNLAQKPWLIAALLSWGIALFEYMFQVPANRIGHSVMSVGQLKIMQEVITLMVFVPFSVFYLKEKLTLDYLWAGLCILGAVFFIFRSKLA
ncbi:DMT family protein [Pokkaliibacter plantistimulans]|uniref:DMT family protein n=1 Tax=Pokkaliibacter plantistimulans TaxID=1635171 RepID=UPI003AF152EA